MASASEIIARLVLQGQREFVSGMDQAAKATGATGKAAETSGKKASSAASGLLKWAAAGGAVYKAYGFFKGAVTQTTDLARATASLERTTGMDARTATAWVVTAKERNVNVLALNRGFLSLGRQITMAGKATSASAKTFRALGLSQADLNNASTEQRIRLVSDALLKIQDPIQRAALGQKLLGRNYLQLASIMGKGSKAISENEDALKKSGATMDQAGVKRGLTMIKTQRELNAAMLGVKIAIATALMPILQSLAQEVQKLLVKYRPWLEMMGRHPGVILAIAGALTTLVAGVKAYNIVLKLWEIGTQLVTKAQWLLNIALDANPVGAIIIGVIALGAALVLAYERVGWFRKAVQSVFHWIVNNWKLLAKIILAPFVPLLDGAQAGQ